MKLLASISLCSMVAARSRISEPDLALDAYGQIHREKIHLEDLLDTWNSTMGVAPPRGWYRMRMEAVEGIDPNQIIKKSGLEGRTSIYAHYCRYRETETCCDREDQNCFTEAGCFCDEACFTTYGDCCQDHFVTCYDKLSLCLHDADEPEAKSASSANAYSDVNREAKKKRERQTMENDFNGALATPQFVEPNACCGQHKYNDAIDCCVVSGEYKSIKRGAACEEEESVDEGADERLQSPAFDFSQFE